MFGIDSIELLVIAVVALVVIGPKDLPKVMRTVGQWVSRARGMARHFRSGMGTMMRDAELQEMEQKWKSDNDRIMSAHPTPPPVSGWGQEQAEPEASSPKAPPVAARPRPAAGSAPPAPPRQRPVPPPAVNSDEQA